MLKFLFLTTHSLAFAFNNYPKPLNSPSSCVDKFPRCKNQLGNCKMPEYREMCCLACKNATPVEMKTPIKTPMKRHIFASNTVMPELSDPNACEDASWCIDEDLNDEQCSDPYYSVKACCKSCSKLVIPKMVEAVELEAKRPTVPQVKISTSYYMSGKLLSAEELKLGF